MATMRRQINLLARALPEARAIVQVLPVPLEMPPFRMSMLWHARFQADAAQVWFRDLVAETAAVLF